MAEPRREHENGDGERRRRRRRRWETAARVAVSAAVRLLVEGIDRGHDEEEDPGDQDDQ